MVALMLGVITVGAGWGAIPPVPPKVSFQGRISPLPVGGIASFAWGWEKKANGELQGPKTVNVSDTTVWKYDPATGIFDAILDIGSAQSASFTQADIYIKINNLPVMGPQAFTTVPYAFRAAVADNVVGGGATQWATSGDDINNTNAGAVGITDLRAYPYTAGSATAGVKDNSIRIKAENYTNQFLLLRSTGTDHAGSAGLQFSDRGYDHFWLYTPAKTGDATLRIAYKHYGDQTENPPLSAGADILTIAGNTGNVGIGNPAPSQRLDVVGNVSASGHVSAGGDVSATNLIASGKVTANSVTAGSVTTGNDVTAGANVSANSNVNAAKNVTAGGNVIADGAKIGPGAPTIRTKYWKKKSNFGQETSFATGLSNITVISLSILEYENNSWTTPTGPTYPNYVRYGNDNKIYYTTSVSARDDSDGYNCKIFLIYQQD